MLPIRVVPFVKVLVMNMRSIGVEIVAMGFSYIFAFWWFVQFHVGSYDVFGSLFTALVSSSIMAAGISVAMSMEGKRDDFLFAHRGELA